MERSAGQTEVQGERLALPPLMTTREVAQALELDPREVNRLANEGILKPVRGFRNPMKFYRETVQNWLNGEGGKR